MRTNSTGFRGIAPDLLGFGRSPKPPDASYDVDCHIAAIAPLVPPDSVVVGHSCGAILAAALAARHRELVRRLILVGLPAYRTEAEAVAAVGRLGLFARLTVDGSIWAQVLCETMCAIRPLAIALGPFVIRDLPPVIVRDGARHTWPSYSRTLHHVLVEHRPDPDLVAARAPVALLHGTKDREVPVQDVQVLTSLLQQSGVDASINVTPGDHHLAVRHPQVIIAAINAEIG